MNDLVQRGQIVLEGMVVPSRVAWLYEAGEAFSPAMVSEALAAFDDGDVTVIVNSPGGDPMSGEAIRAALADHAGTVTVQVRGEAMSAASLLIMGADRIEVTAGSVIMIHDPSTITIGTAAEHEATAARLDKMAGVWAGVYAARAGISREEAREMMRVETWMGPEEAVEMGFADAVSGVEGDPVPAAAAAAMAGAARFDAARASFASMCRTLAEKVGAQSSARTGGQPAAGGGQQQATTAKTEGLSMTNKNTAAPSGETGNGVQVAPAPAPTPPAAAQMSAAQREEIARAERERITGITRMAARHVASGAITEAFVGELTADGSVTVDMASTRILEALASAQPELSMQRPRETHRITRDEGETRREGLVMALTARIAQEDPSDERARPFAEMSIVDMALTSMGRPLQGNMSYAAREDVLMQAAHSGSDFPNILSTSVNRVIQQNYELVGRSFTAISREMSFNDFRTHDLVRGDEFPTLQKVNENGEIKFGALGDSKETAVLGAYATGVRISRQALVNDDLGAIQAVIDNAAAVVPEFEEATFWAMFLANAALADGKAMFHANHGNLGSGSAITQAALGLGRAALRKMKAADGTRNILMNAPEILLVGPDKETEAKQAVRAVASTKTDDVNTFSGELTPVVSEAITGNQWYLLVSPSKRTCNFRHGYLRGRSAPRVRVEEPFGTQGTAMTLEHDFGCAGANYRGGYKNPGA